MELMRCYDSVTQFVGTVSSLSKARPALASLGESAVHMSSEVAKKGVVASSAVTNRQNLFRKCSLNRISKP